MMLSSFVVAGLLALRSSAFLVVPDAKGVNPVDAADARSMSVDLACRRCPFPTDAQELKRVDAHDSTLSLNFTTEGERLLVNGRQCLPEPGEIFPETVLSRVKDGAVTPSLPFGFFAEMAPSELTASEDGPKLFNIRLTVTDVAGYPVPADTLHLSTVKAEDGSLYLVKSSTKITSSPKMCWRKCRGRPGCLSRVLLQRIKALIGCGRSKMAGGPRLSVGKFEFKSIPEPDHRHPHSRPHHGPHGHRHPGYSGRAFARSLRALVLPAVLGLSAGATVCAVGMLLGHAIGSAWTSFRRRQNPRGPAAASDEEFGEDPEKEGLLPEEEYDDEDLPQYEETGNGRIALLAEKE